MQIENCFATVLKNISYNSDLNTCFSNTEITTQAQLVIGKQDLFCLACQLYMFALQRLHKCRQISVWFSTGYVCKVRHESLEHAGM